MYQTRTGFVRRSDRTKTQFVVCESLADYAAHCAGLKRTVGTIPVIRRPAADAKDFDRLISRNMGSRDWKKSCGRIMGGKNKRKVATNCRVIAASGPSAVCAAFLAASTARSLHLLETLNELVNDPSLTARTGIVVATEKEIGDEVIFSILDGFARALDDDVPWSQVPRFTIVTARDLSSLSWMVAKLVVAAAYPLETRIRLRHYAPDRGYSNVSQRYEVNMNAVVSQQPLSGSRLLDSYKEPVNVMAFRTHGAESCADGGDGTVLCGLGLNGANFDALAEGVLACGRGLACPRGPHPIPLAQMATDVLMLGTCNGLRLGHSRTQPQFNFALSFTDGPGIAYVSSVFTSIGGDVSSIAFLAAMAMGQTLGEATALINGLIHHTGLERTSYLAIGDTEYRPRAPVSLELQREVSTFPALINFGSAHFVMLRITDTALIERARLGLLVFRVGDDANCDAFGFHRLERDGTETYVLTLFLFCFPQPLGRLRIEVLDPEIIRAAARDTLGYLEGWITLWRVVGLAETDFDAYRELCAAYENTRDMLSRSLALLSLDGSTASRIEREVKVAKELISAASEGVLEHVAPQLEGSFWLPNLHTTQYRFDRSEFIICPHCELRAFRRTMRHGLINAARTVVVCPRCGVCADIADNSPIDMVWIEAPQLVAAGDVLRLNVLVRLIREATLTVVPRLSTHREPVPGPNPESASGVAVTGTARYPFDFQIPPTLSPHRHYVKVLIATTEGLAFACRPFFVRPS
jgi:hypothetical protein